MYKSSHKTNKDINMDNSEMRRKVKQYKKSKFIMKLQYECIKLKARIKTRNKCTLEYISKNKGIILKFAILITE